jgi:hypothetical protein
MSAQGAGRLSFLKPWQCLTKMGNRLIPITTHTFNYTKVDMQTSDQLLVLAFLCLL